ncbi:pro-resilin [Neocloeon triangulifer]|uniref:pro-resilin n=1 Tax=Neocloeon triangulifer TaxID=2078957 RepID=UPI00286EE35D|nr:pro-resilin [Neocloeon triangulifer]
MKVFVVLALLAAVCAEPPVGNQYLPPGQGGQSGYSRGGPGGFPSGGGGGFSPSASSNNGYSSGGPSGGGFSSGGSNGYPSGGPGGFGSRNDEGSNEPAKYEFKYDVNDPASGSNFGHQESRDGDYVQGEYRVLLPDGRTQIVKYEADQNGYRPTIEYEGEANNGGQGGQGGYPASGQGSFGGASARAPGFGNGPY